MAQVMWKVTDKTTSAEFKKRTHIVILEGVETPFEFNFGKPTSMPREAAMKFIHIIDGFDVVDESGSLIKPSGASIKQTSEPLGESEVIADLTELTDEALKIRAARLPGGEEFMSKEKYNRKGIIDLLINFRVASTIPSSKDDSDDIELSKASLDDIFAGA